MFDFNDAEPQMAPMGALIPDGTFTKLRLAIRPGGVDGPAPGDKGLLRAAKNSDAKMLNCEMTVMDGPFARRKLWQDFTVVGGKLDKQGVSIAWKISKSVFRAMIESALGIDPKDMSEEAKKKRTLQNLAQLDGITFAARIMIDPAQPGYKDQNKLANVVLRGEAQYEAIMRGESVPAEPVNAQPRKPAVTQAAQPSWAGGEGVGAPAATPAQASSAPAWLA